jgi:hypothetical protein
VSKSFKDWGDPPFHKIIAFERETSCIECSKNMLCLARRRLFLPQAAGVEFTVCLRCFHLMWVEPKVSDTLFICSQLAKGRWTRMEEKDLKDYEPTPHNHLFAAVFGSVKMTQQRSFDDNNVCQKNTAHKNCAALYQAYANTRDDVSFTFARDLPKT